MRRVGPGAVVKAGLPNMRLKLSGPAFKGSIRLCPRELDTARRVACARRRSPRSLSAIR